MQPPELRQNDRRLHGVEPETPPENGQVQRRVRVIFAGITVADSKHVMRLLEYGRLPVYYFPLEDVRQEVLEATDHHTHSPLKGKASYWSARIGASVFKDIVWSYRDLLPACSPIDGFLCFFNERVDAIYVDDELVHLPRWSPHPALVVGTDQSVGREFCFLCRASELAASIAASIMQPKSSRLSVRHYEMKWTWISCVSTCSTSFRRRCSQHMNLCGCVRMNNLGNQTPIRSSAILIIGK
jgi:uncharacterized protein (DUF427 family)